MKKRDYTKKIITIPNMLSLFRFGLAFAFLAVYLNTDNRKGHYIALAILVLSAITDVVDGKIARHFNMVSDVGKILDPIADKVTQGFVMFALVSHYPAMIMEIGVFVMKEAYMVFMGLKVMGTGWNEGALWYGKINTVILYGTSMILILWYNIPYILANMLIGIGVLSILYCFYKYHREFIRILAEYKRENMQ